MNDYVPAGLDVPGLDFEGMEEMGADFGKWLLYGQQGAGKTLLSSTIAKFGPTLFVDMVGEKGVQSFKGAPWAHNITIVRPSSVTQLDDIYWKLAEGDHPFVATVLDSLTSVQKQAMRYMLGHSETAVREIRQGTAPADRRTWGQTLDIMTDFATFWYALADAERPKPLHVVMTAQTKSIDDEDSGIREHIPDVQKGALSLTLAAPAYVLYCDKEENLEALGDDTASPVNHIVRFGAHSGYRTKARVPYYLQGKIPPILGRKKPTDLTQLSRVLGIGGVPAAVPAKKTAALKESVANG